MEWRPYVPVAVRHAKARREMNRLRKKGKSIQPVEIEGRTIARSFWGKRWCDHLESFSDYANRLPRGRTYVRNGSVCHLEIHPGRIGAIVMGSELYDVTIRIGKLKAAVWKSIKHRCSGQIGSVLELLQGKLSKQVMGVVTDRQHGLFPKPGEIRFDCSCPDWAAMCKHVASVLYGVGSRLDDRPESLFLLRGVDSAELIATGMALPGDAATGDALADDALAGIFGIDLDTGDAPPPAPKAPAKPRRPARRRAAAPGRQAPPAPKARDVSTSAASGGERPKGCVEHHPRGKDLSGRPASETGRRQGSGRPRVRGVNGACSQNGFKRHPRDEDLSGRHGPETGRRQGSGRPRVRGVNGACSQNGFKHRPRDEDLSGRHGPETRLRQGSGPPGLQGVRGTCPQNGFKHRPRDKHPSNRHAWKTRHRQEGRRRFTARCPSHRKMGGPAAPAVWPLRGPIRRTARRVGGDGVSLGSHARAAQPAHAPAECLDDLVPAVREAGEVIPRSGQGGPGKR